MTPDENTSALPTQLPEFRTADARTWPGDPDFDPVDALLDMPDFRDAAIWSPQGGAPEVLSTVAELALRVAGLADNRFGVVKRRVGRLIRFAQTLRIGDVWIVEVHDGTDGDWASRVLRGARTSPKGVLDPAESWVPLAAADVMWSWLNDGGLPSDLHREALR